MMYLSLQSPCIPSAQFFIAGFFALLLTACGGGGGSGENTNNNNTPPTVTLTANAGEDMEVNAGEVVELIAGGTGDIVGRTWTRLQGPNIPMSVVDLAQAHFTIVAPSTGAAPFIILEYRLTVTASNGDTATDSVVIRVNRVNEPPVANAGGSQTVEGLSEVLLEGVGNDPDGTIVSYLWEQVNAGDAVELIGADQANASFIAPSTDVTLQLEFSLTVTDNDGATASDTLVVTVTSENAPVVDMIFPPPQGGYIANTISAFGTVEPRAGADISEIRVNAGGATVFATVDAEGAWRADNVPVSQDAEDFILTVEAEDSVGRLGLAGSLLQRSEASAGSGVPWRRSTALTLDAEAGIAYVLTTGSNTTDITLIPINLRTGARGASITNFSNATQGVEAFAFTSMIRSPDTGYFYLASSPASADFPTQIISVHPETGLRADVSSDARGAGPDLQNLTSIFWGPEGRLMGVDHTPQRILTFDLDTGDRETYADSDTAGVGVQVPLQAVWDDQNERILVSLNLTGNTSMLSIDTSTEPAEGSTFTSNNGNTGPDLFEEAGGLALDREGGRLFFMNRTANNILSIDLVNGDRSLVVGSLVESSVLSKTSIAYDDTQRLLYAVGGPLSGRFNALYVIDPESGSKVVLSRQRNPFTD